MDRSVHASLGDTPAAAVLAGPTARSLIARAPTVGRNEPVDAKGKVTFRNRGTRREATFVVTGGVMTMDCRFGTFKAAAGCGDPRKFARTLLRSLCRRFEGTGE